MWNIYEILSASTMTIWVIMLLVLTFGYFSEMLLCWSERERQLVDKQWRIYNIVFGIVTLITILSFILVLKLGITK